MKKIFLIGILFFYTSLFPTIIFSQTNSSIGNVGSKGIIPAPAIADEHLKCNDAVFDDREKLSKISIGKKIECGYIELNDLVTLIIYLISFSLYLVPTIGIVMAMYGGVLYMTSGIIEEKKEEGKKAIYYAVTGVIVAYTSWIVVDIIQEWIT